MTNVIDANKLCFESLFYGEGKACSSGNLVTDMDNGF